MNEAAATDALTVHLSALEQSLLDPGSRVEADGVTDFLADDFVEFGSSGQVWTRAATISALALEQPDPSTRKSMIDFNVRLLAENVALVTYSVRRQSLQGDTRSLRSSVWTYADGRWRMTFHQGTPTSASD